MSATLYIKLLELIAEAEQQLLLQEDGSLEKQKTFRRLELLQDRVEALPPEILAQFNDAEVNELEDLKNAEEATEEVSQIDNEILNEVEKIAKLNDLPRTYDAAINKEIDQDLTGTPDLTASMKAKIPEINTDITLKADSSVLLKYASEQKQVKGQYDLGCIAIVWANGKRPKGSVRSMGNAVAQTTRDLSGSLVTFRVTAKDIRVPYQPARKNLNKAEDYVKRVLNKINGHSFDIYDIANSNVLGFSHAGGNTAHLQGTQIRTALHETYHLSPFNLGHAGRILPKGELDAYGDNLSFMGRFPTNKLNAPELWNLGWPGVSNKTAQYDMGTPTVKYNIEQLFYRKPSTNITGVLIKNNNTAGRDMFLSLYNVREHGAKKSTPVFGLHYFTKGPSNGIGTQRIVLFKNQTNYNNLLIRKTADGDNYSSVEISTIGTLNTITPNRTSNYSKLKAKL